MLHCLLTSLARAWGDLNFLRALVVTVIIMISGPEGLWIACFVNLLCSFKVLQTRDVCRLAWWLIHLVKLLDLCHACHRSYRKFGTTGWCYPSKIWDSSFVQHWVYTNSKNFLSYNLRKQSETVTMVVLLQYTLEVSVQTLVHQLPFIKDWSFPSGSLYGYCCWAYCFISFMNAILNSNAWSCHQIRASLLPFWISLAVTFDKNSVTIQNTARCCIPS